MSECVADPLIHPHGYWLDRDHYLGAFDAGLAEALIELCDGARVLDLGCGDGAYVCRLRQAGISADGYDGNPHTPELSNGACGVADLAQPLHRTAADWVLCLEVAEHVPPELEGTLASNIARHARRGVVVSWAAPGQGGRGHVNERDAEWVGRRFTALGFQEDPHAGQLLRAASRLSWLQRNPRVFRRPSATNEGIAALRTVRAAMLTPTLLMGGAERWMLSLARCCDRRSVSWTGTALSAWAPACADICAEMSAFMPVHADRQSGPCADGAPIVRHATARAALEAAAQDADLLIAWGVPRLGEIMAGLELPVVYVSHGSGAWTRETVRGSEDRANHLVAVSEPALATFSAAGRGRAAIIHNGVDVQRCAPTLSRAEVRARWGFGEKDCLIGYAGRYSFEKNPAAAAWAARRLGGNCRAVYAGEGWKERELRALVGRIAGERARFVPRDDCIGNVLSGIDVLVSASPSEGFSLSIAEAWYCGVPVVATRVGAVPELERRHGRLVSAVPVDPTADDLARAVEVALSREFHEEVVPRAQAAACAHYTAGTMARRWGEYLCEVVGGRAGDAVGGAGVHSGSEWTTLPARETALESGLQAACAGVRTGPPAVRERRSLKAELQRQGDAHARRVRYGGARTRAAGELPRRVAIPPPGAVGDWPYPRECWEYLRGTIAALPIELEVDAALGAVCPGAFLLRVDGGEVVYDYSDYLLVDGAQQRYPHWLRFHHTAGFVPHDNIGSFPPISFLDWTEYERLSAELHYDATGDAVLHMQAFEFLADRPSARDRDLYARRKGVRDVLVAAYDGQVFGELESQAAFWRRAAGSLVSVHVPGSWRHSLDRGQHQLIGLGVCTLSPEIWTATLDERIEPGVHYVRCRDDFSDLVERIEWCREHRSECAAIGRRSREFFREHSTPRAIWEYVRRRLTAV